MQTGEVKRTDLAHTLDIRAFTSCSVPPHLEHILLAEDQPISGDLSCAVFRMHRAVGGSWTEYLHIDEDLHRLAAAHSTAAGIASIRICTFCRIGQGTPRHYVMQCLET